MRVFNKILLASHGTPGAAAALDFTLSLCEAGASVQHLLVVPEFWKGMTGDDWLNNGVSRDRFTRYLESELGREADQHIEQVRDRVESANMYYQQEIRVGEPYDCLLSASAEATYDAVIIGSRRPKGTQGLKSKITLDKLSGRISAPLIIVPYPQS